MPSTIEIAYDQPACAESACSSNCAATTTTKPIRSGTAFGKMDYSRRQLTCVNALAKYPPGSLKQLGIDSGDAGNDGPVHPPDALRATKRFERLFRLQDGDRAHGRREHPSRFAVVSRHPDECAVLRRVGYGSDEGPWA